MKPDQLMAMEGVFAIVRSAPSKLGQIEDMSRGDIAIAIYKSKPILMGQVTNISRGGLAFRYFPSEEQSNQSVELDILFADDRFYLENLPFRTILDLNVTNEFTYSSLDRGLMKVQFRDLDLDQISQLDYLIQNCTMEIPSDQDHSQSDDPEYVGLEKRD